MAMASDGSGLLCDDLMFLWMDVIDGGVAGYPGLLSRCFRIVTLYGMVTTIFSCDGDELIRDMSF
jgi:hypothetical protein